MDDTLNVNEAGTGAWALTSCPRLAEATFVTANSWLVNAALDDGRVSAEVALL